ncbi:unnamed protein product [Cyprideis torosa]|uniref:Uncharacterized protein n=1 Tax=Cyprideis torosa TaxID=163714 RepID=A0A7R8ZQ94_9CRUS|nr:unnamed protein product [Cyprideis torosa]CAG0902405.1 unnamed protein product [Cyprideis torosa]
MDFWNAYCMVSYISSIFQNWYQDYARGQELLTAAHCYDPQDYPNFPNTKVRVAFLQWSSKPSVGQTRWMTNVVLHPSYTNQTWDYDLAIVELDKALHLTGPNAKAIRLPSPYDQVRPGNFLIVMGWGGAVVGVHDDQLMTTNELRKVQLTVKNPKQCGVVPSYQFCAEGTKPNSGHCKGDSGGPLVPIGNTAKLLGVVSSRDGYFCAVGIGRYTHVPDHLGFISKEGYKYGYPKVAEYFTDPNAG